MAARSGGEGGFPLHAFRPKEERLRSPPGPRATFSPRETPSRLRPERSPECWRRAIADTTPSRRRVLLQASSLPLAATGLSAVATAIPATAAQTRTLTLVTAWPPNFPGLGTTAARFAERVERMSGGALHLRLLAAGELVPAFEAYDAVEGGTADLYHGAAYYWQGKHPAYAFFTSVPFGPTAIEFQAWLTYGGGQQLWDEVGRQFGLKHLAVGDTGVQMSGWYRQPIESLEDLRGLRIRFPGFAGRVLQQFGAVVVNLAGSEVVPALATGALDGSDWVAPWPDRAMGLHRVAPHYHYPGWQEPSGLLDLGISLRVWESLSEVERSILENAAQAETLATLAEYEIRNAEALEALMAEGEVSIHAWPEEMLDGFAEKAREVLAETAEADPLAGRVYASLQDFLRRAHPWSRVADTALLRARDRRTAF